MKKITSEFFKNSSKYGLGILLARIGGFITLPIYFKFLTFEDFGIISIFQAILTFLNPIYSLILCDSVARFYYEWENDQKNEIISTIFLTSIIFSIIVSVIFYFSGNNVLSYFVDIKSHPYIIILVIITAFFNNVSLIPIVILKANKEIKKYNILVITTFLINSIISLILIIVFNMGVLGYLYGTLFSATILGLYYIYYVFKNFGFYLKIRLLRNPLKFSLPLLPSGILESFSNSLDRILLTYFFDLKYVGIYDLANRIGTIIQAVNQSIKSAWIPLVFEETTSKNKIQQGPVVYANLSFYYVSFMVFICSGIFLFSELFYFLFDSDKFSLVIKYLPLIILLYFAQSLSTALSRGIDIAKKTEYAILIQISGLGILFFLVLIFKENLSFLNFLMIFLISNVLKYIISIYYSYKFYPRPLLVHKYMKLLIISCIILIISIAIKQDKYYLDLFFNAILFFLLTYLIIRINNLLNIKNLIFKK